jgi:REP element-mobilizing transposase RayT
MYYLFKEARLMFENINKKLQIMSTYLQVLYQLVFCTKYRQKTLVGSNRKELFRYMYGILDKRNCHVYIINGVSDHVHIITHVHPSISLSSLIQEIKAGSSNFIKKKELFPDFQGWQNGYGAFTYSSEAKKNLIRYVKNQEQHHGEISSRDELIELLKKEEVAYDLQYLE